jgi:hypothetical protein
MLNRVPDQLSINAVLLNLSCYEWQITATIVQI